MALYRDLCSVPLPLIGAACIFDADWGGCPATQHSTTGYWIFFLTTHSSFGIVRKGTWWLFRTQNLSTVPWYLSTTKEVVHLRHPLVGFGVLCHGHGPPFSDNKTTIMFAVLVFHDRTKHIEIDCHIVRQYFLLKTISLPHISLSEQLDFFTKSNTISRF